MFTKIQKWGNSQGIRIPKQLLIDASFSEGEVVDVVAEDKKIIIKHVQTPLKKYTIESLFVAESSSEYGAKHNSEYKTKEENWGAPVGKEEW